MASFNEETIRATAYHEAGHVVLCVVGGLVFDWVAIQPLPEYFGGRIGDIVFTPEDYGITCFPHELDDSELRSCWFARLGRVDNQARSTMIEANCQNAR